MTALIYLDAQTVHPVIDGEWHRLAGALEAAEVITTLCGITDTPVFMPLSERRNHGIPRQCDACDTIYRRRQGIPSRRDRLSGRRPAQE
ncbi:zinc finger protein [Amycolatopsis balhimycina]|uniref:zinc finger protein n=1 Tax=Amycolatopsis balhimycina TaxID=208443 RepID=UPI0003648E98|nr:zinc finger protein [Amycolatopsis balhimycina]